MILFVKADQNFNNFYFFAKWGNLNLVKYTRSIFAKSSSSKNVTIGHQTRAHALDTVHNTFNWIRTIPRLRTLPTPTRGKVSTFG